MLNRRWLATGMTAVTGAAGALALRRYRSRMGELRGVLTAGSHVAQTSRGPIEYADVGEGPPVLVIHGISGGYDQSLLATRLERDYPLRLIAVSRPGYLRTPLEVGVTPEEQADAYSALLDTLGIERVAVVGISAGGLSALQFALRHPDRCWALVMISGVSKRIVPDFSPAQRLVWNLFNSDFALWLFSKVAEDRLLSIYGVNKRARERYSAQPEKMEVIKGIMMPFPVSLRKSGLDSDMEQFPLVPEYDLSAISAPALVIHGTSDTIVPLAHGQFVADNVPGAERLFVDGGGHLCVVTHKELVLPRIREFLLEHAPDYKRASATPVS